MLALLRNPAAYVGLYVGLMLPTYVLPYFGSNSMLSVIVSGALGAAGLPPMSVVAFVLHAACLLALCYLGWRRGSIVQKSWLVLFPVLAGVFDMMPILSWIPLVPTIMHLLTIILGVVGVPVQANVDRYSPTGV